MGPSGGGVELVGASTLLSSRTAEAALFRASAGSREFNPIAIVVPGRGAAQVVRFWRAFKDFKHGKTDLLLQKEAELERALAAGSHSHHPAG